MIEFGFRSWGDIYLDDEPIFCIDVGKLKVIRFMGSDLPDSIQNVPGFMNQDKIYYD